jgi:hypothetical protein
VEVVIDVPEAVVNDGIDELAVSEPESLAKPGNEVGSVRHRLIPPATTRLASFARIPCRASITALRPEPQTLLMVSAPTDGGSPPPSAA